MSTEVTGTVSEALVVFRQQCMEHLSTFMSAKSGAGTGEANVDAFADDEEVVLEEDNVDKFLKGKNNKKQKS